MCEAQRNTPTPNATRRCGAAWDARRGDATHSREISDKPKAVEQPRVPPSARTLPGPPPSPHTTRVPPAAPGRGARPRARRHAPRQSGGARVRWVAAAPRHRPWCAGGGTHTGELVASLPLSLLFFFPSLPPSGRSATGSRRTSYYSFITTSVLKNVISLSKFECI